MKVLFSYLRPHAKTIAWALAMATLNQCCLLLDPLIMQRVLDRYSLPANSADLYVFLTGIAPWLGAIICSVAIAWLAKSEQTVTVNRVSHTVGATMFSDGVRYCLRMPFYKFETQRSGERVERLHRLKRDVETLLKSFINRIFTSVLAITLIVLYTARVNWVLALSYVIAAPVLTYISMILTRRVSSTNHALFLRHSEVAGNTTETLRNIELVKSLGLTEQEISRFDRASESILQLELEKVKVHRLYTFFHGACVHAMRVSLLLLLFYLRFRNLITVGQFLSVYLYSYSVFGPMQDLGNLILECRESETSLDEFSLLLREAREPHSEGTTLPDIHTLEFASVSFSYPGRTHQVLKDLSFRIHTGETVAFVGPSGAGKTTLVKLISALYRPTVGAITFSGIPCQNLDAESLRMRMGLVTQDTQLFSGSIRDNLLVVRPEATDEELRQKLAQASATGILQRASSGLDTLLGEGALRLSGGERQRIAIARALLREPDLIIFDEATSSLDALTERQITESFVEASHTRKMISIIIAHRLSTVVRADRIYVLDKGAIVESGTHTELISREGLYRQLWERQTGAEAA